MYTFCPDCSTVFSIRAEHLHAASGLVRCGECRQVFSAVDHLYDGLMEARFALFKLAEAEQVQAGDEAVVAGTPPVDESSGEPAVLAVNPEPRVAGALPRSSWSRQPVSMRDVASGAGIGLLVLLLAGQWAYFNRADLAMRPSWRPVVERICSVAACELPLPSDIDQVALLDRDVRRHPEIRDALLVNATLVNRAEFTQSYPVLSIRFSDLAGKPIAERRFRPTEYLGEDLNYDDGMAPAAPVHVVLEIEDPGEEAVSFQFDFL
jgi:predicted Zn finger-like uncharacterized protein